MLRMAARISFADSKCDMLLTVAKPNAVSTGPSTTLVAPSQAQPQQQPSAAPAGQQQQQASLMPPQDASTSADGAVTGRPIRPRTARAAPPKIKSNLVEDEPLVWGSACGPADTGHGVLMLISYMMQMADESRLRSGLAGAGYGAL